MEKFVQKGERILSAHLCKSPFVSYDWNINLNVTKDRFECAKDRLPVFLTGLTHEAWQCISIYVAGYGAGCQKGVSCVSLALNHVPTWCNSCALPGMMKRLSTFYIVVAWNWIQLSDTPMTSVWLRYILTRLRPRVNPGKKEIGVWASAQGA